MTPAHRMDAIQRHPKSNEFAGSIRSALFFSGIIGVGRQGFGCRRSRFRCQLRLPPHSWSKASHKRRRRMFVIVEDMNVDLGLPDVRALRPDVSVCEVPAVPGQTFGAVSLWAKLLLFSD